jgi:hypothetical protein
VSQERSPERRPRSPVTRIEVRLQIGESLLAASDDPLFLGLRGPDGREFRLELAKGRSLRRGAEDHYVLASPQDAAANVKHAELNDPTVPPVCADALEGVYLRKGTDPIPNVRAVGELDDRLEILDASVEVHAEGRAAPLRFERRGPIWLGLAAGLRFDLARRSGTP